MEPDYIQANESAYDASAAYYLDKRGKERELARTVVTPFLQYLDSLLGKL